ncbi:2-polyprenyl-6-methoxyphenol hydroxylase-like FAD-dependent oxidoreductase [Sinobaca qinghaiensis]|uniref:2-polyprenyl-6-methoxyphenol hydroxylase-like FAD-dependent oxidoreductase n=2 Tax=Sinobaca qinghaiensis TaxID=342944 RepID=A0A419V5K0_9BACL|nr:2-polyprenyl-6-methoxyphenol hydroxylase-like FAD-dependent oxidoreductase [Sinobaca qinghaiensis]
MTAGSTERKGILMNKQEVIIIGAGPTGLTLALELSRYHIPFRIIAKDSGPGEASRAMAVVPRTLEFYRQFGIDQEVINNGIKLDNILVRVEGEEKAKVNFQQLGGDLSPYPFVLTYPQDDHEAFLIEKLKKQGTEIEWGTELVSFSHHAEGTTAIVKKEGQLEEIQSAYLVGCDGASSVVRTELDIDFKGGTYPQIFCVIDIEGEGEAISSRSMNMCFSGDEFAIFMPVRSSGTTRLISIIPKELQDQGKTSFEEIKPFLESAFKVRIDKVNWYSTYSVHHRVAERFQKGRVFLAGDAAHIHSPAGGQGMNTGIGDAVNLGWKLASVIQKRADATVLETYSPERRDFAKVLVASTDRAFTRIVAKDKPSKLLRKNIIPAGIPLLNYSAFIRRIVFNILSQIRVNYKKSELSYGHKNRLYAGQRLPYTGYNYDALKEMDWQIHIYGQASASMKEFASTHHITLFEWVWNKRAAKAGLVEDALCFIRPDGHIGFLSEYQDTHELKAYMREHGIVTEAAISSTME